MFVIIFIISISASFIYIKTSPKLEINSANNLVLYDDAKEVFFHGNESKEWVNLNEISDYLIDATIYTEDKNFYKHFGFIFFEF